MCECMYLHKICKFCYYFFPQKSYLQDCLWYIKELFSYLSVWNVLCVECPFIAFLKALLFRFMTVHIIYFSLKCNMYLQCLQNCMLHVLSSFLWNVYVCALINKPFLENWKMQIYLKRFFFSPLIEIKVFYSINLLLVSKCDTSNPIMCENFVGFFFKSWIHVRVHMKKKILFCIDI